MFAYNFQCGLLDSKRVGSAPGSLEQQAHSSVGQVTIFSPLFAAASVHATAAAASEPSGSVTEGALSSESLVSESERPWSAGYWPGIPRVASAPVRTASRTNAMFAMFATFIGTRAAFALS
jgi:hypothetical protein